MIDPGVDGENPYAEPKTPLDGPARKTGFTTTQGLAIIALCTILFLSIYQAQHSARVARWRAAAQQAAEAEARKKAALFPHGPSARPR